MICSDGLLDLGLDTPGLREIHADGINEVNPLFRNFERDGTVTGYGISCPGRMYQKILSLHNGQLSAAEQEAAMSPTALGFYTTLVLEAAERSLANGKKLSAGVTVGKTVQTSELVRQQIGAAAAREYGLK